MASSAKEARYTHFACFCDTQSPSVPAFSRNIAGMLFMHHSLDHRIAHAIH